MPAQQYYFGGVMPFYDFYNMNSIYDYYPRTYSYYGYDNSRFTYEPEYKKAEVKTEVKSETKTEVKTDKNKDLRQNFLTVAEKYSNCKESDNSHLKFCTNDNCKTADPHNKEWCTDFVSYVVKESYKNNGKKIPEGFGNHDVRQLKEWAIKNGYFLKVAGQNNKGNLIKGKVKPGDIVIFNEQKPNGEFASHTGFVKEINKDGSFSTIEGNRNNKVGIASYSPDYNLISGFIQLT